MYVCTAAVYCTGNTALCVVQCRVPPRDVHESRGHKLVRVAVAVVVVVVVVVVH